MPKGKGKTRRSKPWDQEVASGPDELMDSDGHSSTSSEPDSATAAKALRVVEEIFGTEHFLTKNGHQELLRIQALEEANIPEVPIHVAIGDVAFRLDKLTRKLERQAALMVHATHQHHQAEERISELASNMAGTETEIRHTQAERHNLLAACHLSNNKLPDTGNIGSIALEHFFGRGWRIGRP
jgi:hypothetical protein